MNQPNKEIKQNKWNAASSEIQDVPFFLFKTCKLDVPAS